MKLTTLSAGLAALSVVALVGLLGLGAWAVVELRAHERHVQELVRLQARADEVSAASDAVLLAPLGGGQHEAFQRKARALQTDLAERTDTSPEAERALIAIEEMIVLATTYAGAVDGPSPARGAPRGPLGIPADSVAVMNRMAAAGRTLDGAMSTLLLAQHDTGEHMAYRAVLGFFGASFLFAIVGLLTSVSVHRRLGDPLGRLVGVVDRVTAGDDRARARIPGRDEVARLGAALDRMLDHQAASEAALSQGKQLLEESQRIARIGSWRRDLRTDERIWTAETYRIAGRSPDAFPPTRSALLEMVHPDDLPRLEAMERSVEAGEETIEDQLRFVRPDGEVRHVNLRGQLSYDAEGNAVAVAGTMQDITEFVEVLEQLREHRRFLEMASRVARLGGWRVDFASGGFTCSDTTRDIAEVPPGTSPTPEQALAYVAAEHRPRLRYAFDRTSRLGKALDEELVLVTTNRRRLWVRVVGEPVRDRDGAIIAVQGAVQDVDGRKRAELELERLAFRDKLTGCYSRDGFVRTLGARLADGGWAPQGVLASLDVADLRDINEAHGYAAGDEVLIELGRHLQERAGDGGLVARTGGDGFVVFMPALEPEGELVHALGARTDGTFEHAFQISGQQLRLSAHIGFAYLGEEPRDVEALLREAEIALHAAQHGGAKNGRAYTHDLHEATIARVQLGQELTRALEREEFRLHYQPRVDLRSGQLIAAEALVRWEHPDRGLLPPGAFIEVAERSGAIVPIGRWVLFEACRALHAWREQGLDIVSISVNVSAEQLREGDFAREVGRALEMYRMPPEHLILEITESVFMRESHELREQLEALHALGVHIALDDFGTGYSSLAYLKDYPFTQIKIDRTFVQNLPGDSYGQSIVKAVLHVAGAIGVETVAEGVERADQRDALLALGCTSAQGYYFSVPLSGEDFEWLLARRSPLPLATPE